jgi:hypothetical protein
MADWTRAIKEGRLTADEPDLDIAAALAKGLKQSEGNHFNHKKQQQQQALHQQHQLAPGTTLNIFNGITADGALQQIRQQQQPSAVDDNLPSSQPSETPALELYTAFFNDMAQSPRWSGYTGILDDIRTTLLDNGYDLEAAAAITKEDWLRYDLKAGQYDNFKKCLSKWRNRRKNR